MPTYALGRPLPSPPPCAHGGGGGPESTGKTDRPEPVFLRRCRGRDWDWTVLRTLPAYDTSPVFTTGLM